MIKCIECGYTGPAKFTDEAVKECYEVCPQCNGINYDVFVDQPTNNKDNNERAHTRRKD